MELFNNHVKLLRMEQAITQKQAAKEFGVTEATWQRYESNRLPSIRNCIALADYFDVSLDYLLGRSEHRSVL
ncbi:helix-turn-helix domain-containing protein [Lactococcus garvieae]|jgi:repressor LexA|uniref:helix-turn-helix domain-containing protein n=1 Tax=Lactococcus garvieae TaxID=1363 RepID=UPI0002FEBFA3